MEPNICDLIIGNHCLPFRLTLTNTTPEKLALLDYPNLEDYYIVGSPHGYGEERYWTAYLGRHAPYGLYGGKEYTGQGKTSIEAYEDMFGKVVADVDEFYGWVVNFVFWGLGDSELTVVLDGIDW
jgi:hypothetical protein